MKFILIISFLFSTATAQNKFFFALNKTGITIGGGTTGLFAFTLPASAHTSAGVFKNDSILVRTLWSDSVITAGTKTAKWDGTDDYGNAIASPAANYKIKVLTNNVQYTWLGGSVGNTSDSATGTTRHKGLYHCMRGLAFSGSFGYFCTGYGEGQCGIAKFNIATPNKKIFIYPLNQSTGDVNYVATDGTNVYWSVYDSYTPSKGAVFATKTSDDTEVAFTSGISFTLGDGKVYSNAISYLNVSSSIISGLAVQKTGSYLFVARRDLNQLQVLNKTTGALAQTLTYTSPKGLSVDGSNNLWMVTGTTVAKYTVNGDGTLTAATLTLSGLVNPISTQVNTAGTEVSITDGGSSQQIKVFNNSTGSLLNTIGTANGYNADANVTDSKFYFSNIDNNTDGQYGVLPFIAFQSDGSYWVGDPGNFRVQHFNSSNTYSNRIMSLGSTYSVHTDRNTPTRMLSELLEFQIDYTAPLTGTTGWILKRNYGGIFSRSVYNGPPSDILTLSNGKAYGLVRRLTNQFEVVEFQTTGTIRLTGQVLNGFGNIIANDGSLQVYTESGAGNPSQITRYPITSFDGLNNPVWSSTGEVLAIANQSDTAVGSPVFYPSGQAFNSNRVGFFFTNPWRFDSSGIRRWHKGYHVGIMSRGASNTFLSQTEKSTYKEYGGDYPGAGWFDVGNIVNANAGGNMNVIDRYLITSYHGEFWKNSQTNKFNFYYDNGLAIGQFGITGPEALASPNLSMLAGNVLTPTVVKVGGGDSLYLLHGDESIFAGNHIWKITNLNSISEQVITIPFPSSYTPATINYVDLTAGLPFNSALPNGTAGWSRSPATNNSLWQVNTSQYEYDPRKPIDVSIKLEEVSTTQTNTVSRDLGTNNVTNDWTVSGEVFYDWAAAYNHIPLFVNFDILDATGKLLTTFYIQTDDNGYPSMISTIKFNTVTLLSVTENLHPTTDAIITRFRPFSISVVGGSITFTYAGLSPVTTTISDATGNWRTPKTLRTTFYHNGAAGIAYSRKTAYKKLKFYKDIL